MKSEIPPDDPRSIWQNQEKERSVMSVTDVRLKAYEMQAKIRKNLKITIAFGVLLLTLSTLAIMKLPYAASRLITATLMMMIAIIIYRAVRIFWSPEILPHEAGLNACLEFYRGELKAQYRRVRGDWLNWTSDIVLFFLLLRLSLTGTFRYEAARFFAPVCIGLLVFMRYWRTRQLGRELRELDAFEKENN